MSAPYVSQRRLVGNSLSAMLAAIEIYNKPRVTYREEITVIMVVNAWELALKATLRKNKTSIFYKKTRGQRYVSLTVDDALGRVSAHGLWPASVDGNSITANVKALSVYRDRATHLYNASGLGSVLYPFLQQSVINYRDFVFSVFGKDLAESITWQLLPLGATVPADGVQFMRADASATMLREVQGFIDELRALMDEAEAAGGDMGRVATVYDINLQSVKKMTAADLAVAVSPDAESKMALKKMDPNQTHPYTATELVAKVNERRKGRVLTSYDQQAVAWKEGLRTDPKYAWQHKKSATCTWSGDAIALMAGTSDDEFDGYRREYGEYLKTRRSSK